jgi:formylglycine-generating enzyme required for sulfatase activity
MGLNLQPELSIARQHTDALFSLLTPDALYERPIPDRHRLIFYLGHLDAFDWNQVCRGALDIPSFHPTFDRLFAFGIDPPVGCAPQDTAADWPSVDEVRTYCRRVREQFDQVFDKATDQLLRVALEHRWMHAETLAYLLHNLPPDAKLGPPTPSKRMERSMHPRPRFLEIPKGPATLGRARNNGFGWDNEFEAHRVEVPRFGIAKHKTTNGEYLEFVNAGGLPPHYWTRRSGGWYLRTMFEEVPLPYDWPVFVTHAQAQSYANWVGKDLPTEAQFHRAAYATPSGEEREYPWGVERPNRSRGNFDFVRWDPEPVNATPAGDSAFGISQLSGNGWEWTSTVFEPFPGFQPFAFYPGYSADFFDGGHYVIKGGSPRTAAPLLRRSFRNWFRPDYPYVYAGFRLVEN